MRKQGLPFACDQCKQTFNSKGAREMHRKTNHQVRVHSFAEVADQLRERTAPRPRQGVHLGRAVVALIVSLASASFFAALVRFGFQPLFAGIPWWGPMLAANLFGLGVGVSILAMRPKVAKTVANKQQNWPKKVA